METWLPLLVALLGGFLAYKGVIKQSKAASVSNFRVNWINDLRNDYSKFLIALRNMYSHFKEDDIDQTNFLKTRIKLMLNHNEKEHIAFWKAFTNYMLAHNEYYEEGFFGEKEKGLDNLREKMEQSLLIIFKKEWEKAKKLN